jgi:hypothetical protein
MTNDSYLTAARLIPPSREIAWQRYGYYFLIRPILALAAAEAVGVPMRREPDPRSLSTSVTQRLRVYSLAAPLKTPEGQHPAWDIRLEQGVGGEGLDRRIGPMKSRQAHSFQNPLKRSAASSV